MESPGAQLLAQETGAVVLVDTTRVKAVAKETMQGIRVDSFLQAGVHPYSRLWYSSCDPATYYHSNMRDTCYDPGAVLRFQQVATHVGTWRLQFDEESMTIIRTPLVEAPVVNPSSGLRQQFNQRPALWCTTRVAAKDDACPCP